MKIKFLKLKSWLLTTVMGVLGLSGCKSVAPIVPEVGEPLEPVYEQPREEIRLMYGVPTMNYRIHGKVQDQEGRPISDIRINMLERNIETTADSVHGDPELVGKYLENTSVKTDAEGHFKIEESGFPQEQLRILVRDVDGEKGGEFKNRLVEVPVTREAIDTTGAGGWFQGTFRHEMEINLEQK